LGVKRTSIELNEMSISEKPTSKIASWR
jgi:hypothetical protein